MVADELTRACFAYECQVIDVTPSNIEAALAWRPDLVFVESAWRGRRNAWKFRVAAYPDHPERNKQDLAQLLQRARELGIPSVSWNKGGDVHCERFIDSAQLADAILTVGESGVERYRAIVGPAVNVGAL